jgi:hypothetical protein
VDERRHPPVAAIVLGAVLVQALLVLAFVVPGHKPEPHDVPVVVAGPPQAAQAIAAQVNRRQPGAFEITSVPDAAEAEEAILDRDAYGALVPQANELLIATAASRPVAQLLQAAFARPRTEVRELKPLDPDDPLGTTLGLIGIPLIVVCLPVGLLLRRLPLPTATLAALAFAGLAGLAVIAVIHGWLSALPGPYFALAGIAALLVAAVVLPAVGAVRLLGPPGLGLVALVIFVIGNPASGAATAPELLPDFWRAVGQFLPPGAGIAALRNTAYFDGAKLGRPLLVLVAFAAAGLALIAFSRRRATTAAPAR